MTLKTGQGRQKTGQEQVKPNLLRLSRSSYNKVWLYVTVRPEISTHTHTDSDTQVCMIHTCTHTTQHTWEWVSNVAFNWLCLSFLLSLSLPWSHHNKSMLIANIVYVNCCWWLHKKTLPDLSWTELNIHVYSLSIIYLNLFLEDLLLMLLPPSITQGQLRVSHVLTPHKFVHQHRIVHSNTSLGSTYTNLSIYTYTTKTVKLKDRSIDIYIYR